MSQTSEPDLEPPTHTLGALRNGRIGDLQPEPPDFSITTTNVDAEIATIAGPQLVVPATNARYALNAANARWGSLYDALYGTDAVSDNGGAVRGPGHNSIRERRVIERVRDLLDQSAPLASISPVPVRRVAACRS